MYILSFAFYIKGMYISFCIHYLYCRRYFCHGAYIHGPLKFNTLRKLWTKYYLFSKKKFFDNIHQIGKRCLHLEKIYDIFQWMIIKTRIIHLSRLSQVLWNPYWFYQVWCSWSFLLSTNSLEVIKHRICLPLRYSQYNYVRGKIYFRYTHGMFLFMKMFNN